MIRSYAIYYSTTALLGLVTAYQFLLFWAPALAGFAALLMIDALKRDKKILMISYAICCVPGLFTALLWGGLPVAYTMLRGRAAEFPEWHLLLIGGEFAAGLAVGVGWLRTGVSRLEKMQSHVSRKTSLERDKKTDIRHIDTILPPEIGRYDPLRYFDPRKGIFVGLDKSQKPIYCDATMFDESHLMLCGRTRSGKGVAAQIIGTQSIRRKELFVVLDPKLDAWMPHIFMSECAAAKQPWAYLDLRQSAPPQLNPFDDANEEEIENLLLAAFSLAEKGDAADFYRVGDRRAALEVARMIIMMRQARGYTPTPAELMATEQAAKWQETATNFHGYMLEMAELPSVNASRPTLSLTGLAETGGCLYVVGDMANSRVVRMQRLMLLRLMQLAKKRVTFDGNPPRIIRVFADEFTVHISRPFLVSLAASAGWRLCIILAFQTLGDLADVPADLTPDAVKAKVWENCALKLLYAVRDSDTAEWLARSTGTIQVDDESRKVDKNLALSETVDSERTLRQSESNLIDVNMLLGLPKGCGVLFGASRLPEFCYTAPVTANRTQDAITPTHPALPLGAVSAPGGRGGPLPQQKSVAASLVDLDPIVPPATGGKALVTAAPSLDSSLEDFPI